MLRHLDKTPTILLSQKILAEIYGTFILVFSVGVTQGDATSVAPALWAAMISTGFVSGAQFNPAVSIAVCVNALITKAEDLNKKLYTSAIFIFIQMATGMLASYLAYLVVNTDYKRVAYFDATAGYSLGEIFLAEMFFTTVLTGCALVSGHVTDSNILAGGVVAVTVSAADFAVGNYSGGCFNPAVGYGINLIYYLVEVTPHNIWLYIIAPSVGGVLGGIFSTFFIHYKKDLSELRKKYY